tara:strand:+ start:2034 stop:3137 length:1104 start_codon:yes stop_codon:yes gene_type:complete
MKISKIKNSNISYPVFIGSRAINLLGKKIKLHCINAKKVAVVFDKKVPKKYKKIVKKQLKNYQIYFYEYSVNENLKSFKKVNHLAEKLIQNNFNRSDVLLSVGGGIVGDFSGFVASIVKRGMNHVNLPSTLLAQVDSSIGGKTGVNSKSGKNLIGSFYQPKLVIIELKFLESLSKRNMVCGFAEILKHSLIHDRNFFNWIKKNSKKIIVELNFNAIRYAIIKSCKIKIHFVSQDEREENKRAILNFGHTFAHGIEATDNFSRRINHGEAVLIGMYLATKLSFRKKICSFATLNEIKKFYENNRLPLDLKKYFSKKYLDKIVEYMAGDKKNIDEKINLILLKSIGKTSRPGEYRIKVGDMKKIIKKIS